MSFDNTLSRSSLASQDRKLRYRALLEDLSTLEDDSGNNEECVERTASAVRQAQVLLAEGGSDTLKHPGEGYLDSRVLRATSDLAVRCSEAVSGNVNTYDRHELAAHIHDNPDFWQFMFPREVPVFSYVFGTFAPTPPEQRARAPRRQADKQKVAELKRPDDVDKLDKTDEGSEMVSRVNRFITKKYRNNGSTPLSYFHTVVDPTSFATTVENIYYVSFLVRDGLVAVDLDESGLPHITPVPASQRETDQRDLADENQFIVSIDINTWKELIKAFHLREPMMVLKRS